MLKLLQLSTNGVVNKMQEDKCMVCKSCNATLVDGAKFCSQCGSKVEVEIVCSQCGVKLTEEAKFCFSCGAKVEKQLQGEFENKEDDDDWDTWVMPSMESQHIQKSRIEDNFGDKSLKANSVIDLIGNVTSKNNKYEQLHSNQLSQDIDTQIAKNNDKSAFHSEYYFGAYNSFSKWGCEYEGKLYFNGNFLTGDASSLYVIDKNKNVEVITFKDKDFTQDIAINQHGIYCCNYNTKSISLFDFSGKKKGKVKLKLKEKMECTAAPIYIYDKYIYNIHMLERELTLYRHDIYSGNIENIWNSKEERTLSLLKKYVGDIENKKVNLTRLCVGEKMIVIGMDILITGQWWNTDEKIMCAYITINIENGEIKLLDLRERNEKEQILTINIKDEKIWWYRIEENIDLLSSSIKEPHNLTEVYSYKDIEYFWGNVASCLKEHINGRYYSCDDCTIWFEGYELYALMRDGAKGVMLHPDKGVIELKGEAQSKVLEMYGDWMYIGKYCPWDYSIYPKGRIPEDSNKFNVKQFLKKQLEK